MSLVYGLDTATTSYALQRLGAEHPPHTRRLGALFSQCETAVWSSPGLVDT